MFGQRGNTVFFLFNKDVFQTTSPYLHFTALAANSFCLLMREQLKEMKRGGDRGMSNEH